MNVIKEKWNMICIALYAVTIVCLLLPAYSAFGFGVSAFTVLFEASFGAIVLFLVPVGGLVFSIVTKEKKNYLIHMILFILGLILVLISKSILAGEYGAGPDLIYLPEVDFDLDAFMAKVQDIYDKNGKCIVAVSEGIKDKNGKYISEYGADLANSKDSFGHAQLGGLASFLANEIKKKTGAKVRGIELSLLQRCAAHCASKTDIEESFAAGKAAVEYAVAGTTDKMVGFERTSENGAYKCNIKLFDLTVVANTEKKVPAEWLNATKDGLNEKFVEYALPLIQGETDLCKEDGLPRFVKLKKVKA